MSSFLQLLLLLVLTFDWNWCFFCNIMNLCNFSSFVVCCLRVFARSVRVLIVGCLQQGIGVGQAWLSIQVFIKRTSSSGELD